MTLPTDPTERKKLHLWTFMFGYFVDAWLEVVRVARIGNDQHNPGEPLHWARGKSTDQMNAAFNHLFDYGMGGKKDTDGAYHLAKAIWRLSAQLQLDLEAEREAANNGKSGYNAIADQRPEWVESLVGSVDDGAFPLHPDDKPLPTAHPLGNRLHLQGGF